MKKRLLSTLLALCMVLALLPAQILAADADYDLENDWFKILDYTDTYVYENYLSGVLWTDTNNVNHVPGRSGYIFKDAGEGWYIIENSQDGTVLTVEGNGTEVGTRVVLAGLRNNSYGQMWKLAKPAGTSGKYGQLVNRLSGLVMGTKDGAAPANQTELALCAWSQDPAQTSLWRIVKLKENEGDEKLLDDKYAVTPVELATAPQPDPQVDGDRVAASNNFASDYFTLETADGAYQVEHYKGTGSPSLWNAYSTSSNVGNGGWQLTPTKDGSYRITTSSGEALAATSASTVVWNQTPSATDKAQQWNLVADTSTETAYDCKIVNAQYNTQLTYATPIVNDSDLSLAASGESWVVRNLKQTEILGYLALVTPGPAEYVEWETLTNIAVSSQTGAVARDPSYDGPQVTKVRVLNEADFLEIHWDRYVDEVQAINVDNFVLKNGDTVIELEARGSDYTNTLYFDKNNKEVAATDANCMSRLADDTHFSSIGYVGTIDPSKGLTLEVKGNAIKDENGKTAKSAAYQGVPKVDYYTQFYTSKTGIVIKADDTVAYSSLVAAAAQVDIELSVTSTGIAANMAKYGCSLAVYSPQQNAYFVPEHRYGFRTSMYDVEGYGGSFSNNCVSSIAERNVLRTTGNANAVLNTAYPNENILLHEFGHCIKSVGIESLEDQTLADELFAAYEHAKETGLWPNTYAISNSDEYFATMCAIWFNVMSEASNWDDGTRCPINTREELRKYDPQTYAFFAKILPSTATLPSPWDVPAPDVYHNEYVDPAPLGDQVEAVNSNFETDLFMVEAPYRGEVKLIEKYAPDESRPGENLCLWWEYSEDPTNVEQNWAYKVIKTAEGYYRFVTFDGTASVTATSASTVAAEGHMPDAADTAQQWRFVADTSTASLYDGKLVSVKYGTELAFERPYDNGSIVYLASAGSGDRWFIRNVTQSASVGKDAYLISWSIPNDSQTTGTSFLSIPTVTGGKVVSTKLNAEAGDWVTLYVTPDEGYELESITVTDARGWPVTLQDLGNGTYMFTMPASRINVNAVFKEIASETSNNPFDVNNFAGIGSWVPEAPEKFPVVRTGSMAFADVRTGDWYYDAVKYSWQRGIMNGTDSASFEPNGTMTRAMVWTVLARLNGRDTEGGSPWYQKGLDYVTYNDISDGTDPNGSITRQQLVTMLWRNQGEPYSSGASLTGFTDASQVADWADSAVRWAVSAGLLQGDNGALNPAANATRAEVAAILMRYCENVA